MKTEIMTLNAKDLTKEYPRSPRETLAGYVIAARMLDKCRAAISGTLGEYHFDCPLDRYFLQFAGIDAESFRSFVAILYPASYLDAGGSASRASNRAK